MLLDSALIHTLQSIVGPKHVYATPGLVLTYEVDAGMISGAPDTVVLPTRPEQVAPLVRCLAEAGVPIIAWGAGTGLSGGAVAARGGVVISFANLRRVDLDPAARQAVVEPGIITDHLDRAAAAQGLAYPPDPASGRASTVGGNIAENAGGPRCLKYGVTANYVLGLETVLADGSVCSFGGPALDTPEVHFLGVLIGSEGTLALTTRARVRLVKRPEAACTLMAAFRTPEEAGAVVWEIIRRGLRPASLELIDGLMYSLVERQLRMGLPPGAGALLVGDVEGYAEALSAKVQQIEEIARRHDPLLLRVTTEAAEREAIWYARKGAAGAVALLAPNNYSMDVAVPRSRLPEVFREISRLGAEAGFPVGYLAHAGDGNLHPEILCDLSKPGELERVLALHDVATEFVVGLGGSLTGEHGVGLERQRHLPLMYGPDELAAMQDVKAVFDPQGLLNPGKIFPTERPLSSPLPPSLPCEGREGGVTPPFPGKEGGVGEIGSPASIPELQDILRSLQAEKRPVWLAGGQTKCAPNGITLLSTRGLTGILARAYDDLYVTVAAGTRLADVQAELAADGYLLPLAAPWPGATVGGTIAANFNAPWRGLYGSIRDLLLCAEVVLPDGRKLRLGRPLVKDVAGYALAKLFVGSFGVFGVLTAVSLRVFPRPQAALTLTLPCPDLPAALAAGRALGQPAEYVSALLLLQHPAEGLLPSHAPYHVVSTIEGAAEDVALAARECCRAVEQAGLPPPVSREDVTGTALWAQMLGGAGHVFRAGVSPDALPSLLAAMGRDETPRVADLAHGLLYVCHVPGTCEVPGTSQALPDEYGFSLGRDVFPPHCFQMAAQPMRFARDLKQRWDPAGVLNEDLLRNTAKVATERFDRLSRFA